jgi:dihydroorotase
MSTGLLIRGGRIIDPSQGWDSVGDVFVSDGRIVWIGNGSIERPEKDISSINAGGLVVCPGFIDLHCHLREPGFEDKETIASGTAAAARGGYTTVCSMPNTDPPVDTRSVVDYVRETAEKQGVVRVLPVGCITKGRQGRELVEMSELAESGVIAFSDDGDPVSSSRLMTLAMEYARDLGVPIFDHCEDEELSSGGSVNEGWLSVRLGLKGIPAAAEEMIVARDIALAEFTRARVHICHVSTARAVELIGRAKEKGLMVTAEVTPHHLVLTEDRVLGRDPGNYKQIGYDTNAKVNPPLRTREDAEALIKGLNSGIIDAIATDHAPHTLTDKMCEFGLAAFGISGFETAFGSLMSLVHKGRLSLNILVEKLTSAPAAIIGNKYGGLGTLQRGSVADVVLFDPDRDWEVKAEHFVSKGKNTPFDGDQLTGKVVMTIVAGKVVYQYEHLKARSKQ